VAGQKYLLACDKYVFLVRREGNNKMNFDYVFQSNPQLTGQARLDTGIVFAKRGDQELTIDVLTPWRSAPTDDRKYPLVVFVQGSGFGTPDRGYELPQISQLARRGFVVASVTHRNCYEGHKAPAYLIDVKAAIRFLRAHAEDFFIDPDKVLIWGTSSGGNTALMVALTGDKAIYKDAIYPEFSDAVLAAVDCFGPLNFHTQDPEAKSDMIRCLIGKPEDKDFNKRCDEFSPQSYLDEATQIPPLFLLHGDKDSLVPIEQSTDFYTKAKAKGFDVEMALVEGAEHEHDFWSQDLLDCIFDFIESCAQ
jgi:acetyl esterase/lipase